MNTATRNEKPGKPDYRLIADMDGTLLPNGKWADNDSLQRLGKVLSENNIKLSILTGRSMRSIQEAMEEYPIPEPEVIFACGGSELYLPETSSDSETPGWKLCTEHQAFLKEENPQWKPHEIFRHLRGIPLLSPQEDIHQSEYKVCFYLDSAFYGPVITKIQERLSPLNIEYSLHPYPIPEDNFTYIDLMGRGADKGSALDWFQRLVDSPFIFAGDNYNDKPAFLSKHPSILVRNTPDEIINEVREKAPSQFIATEINPERSGYYSDGIIQGLEKMGWVS